MRKSKLILLSAVPMAALSCGYEMDLQDFYSVPLEKTDSKVMERKIELPSSEPSNFDTADCLIYDTLAFSFGHRQDYIVSVSNVTTGELIGKFCKRGRAWEEPMNGLPLQELYVEDGDLKADIISYSDSKLFVWNISESLRDGKDVYDSIVKLDTGAGKSFSIISYRRLDSSRLICYNSKQTKGHSEEDLPEFTIYDTKSGLKINEYVIFAKPDIQIKEGHSYRDYCSNRFTVKPDKTKAFIAMSSLPVCSIMDLVQDTVAAWEFTDMKRFSLDDRRWYFADVQSDDNYIYVLFSGEILYNDEGTDVPETLLVFDWDGELKLKCRLSERFTEINLDGDFVYFTHYEGYMSKVKLNDITDMI